YHRCNNNKKASKFLFSQSNIIPMFNCCLLKNGERQECTFFPDEKRGLKITFGWVLLIMHNKITIKQRNHNIKH
uniref:Uncharacterized protein n=1 Tax=Hippocampus comes TaxID=109280 RepID=A0A3Q2XUL5_HIPCM